MTIVKMSKFGRTLTDRADGQNAFKLIVEEYAAPFALDFSGVMSLGSSFGDEVVIKLAERQDNRIEVIHANEGVRSCIKRVIEGTDITVNIV